MLVLSLKLLYHLLPSPGVLSGMDVLETSERSKFLSLSNNSRIIDVLVVVFATTTTTTTTTTTMTNFAQMVPDTKTGVTYSFQEVSATYFQLHAAINDNVPQTGRTYR